LKTSCFASAVSNADRARCAAVFFPRSARVAALICAAVSSANGVGLSSQALQVAFDGTANAKPR
jgi:hypothetical protein